MDTTAVGFVADLSFSPFRDLARGRFGEGPTRDDHTLLLLNPRLTTAANIGQPWDRRLRRDAREIVDETDWRWIYGARALASPDGSCAGTIVATCADSLRDGDGDGSCSTCTCTAAPDGRVLRTTYAPISAQVTNGPFDRSVIAQARSDLAEDGKRVG